MPNYHCSEQMFLSINLGPKGPEPSTMVCLVCGHEVPIPGMSIGWAKPRWLGYEHFPGPESPDQEKAGPREPEKKKTTHRAPTEVTGGLWDEVEATEGDSRNQTV